MIPFTVRDSREQFGFPQEGSETGAHLKQLSVLDCRPFSIFIALRMIKTQNRFHTAHFNSTAQSHFNLIYPHTGNSLARGKAGLPTDRRGVPVVRVPQVLQLRQRHQEVRGQERLQSRKVAHAHV